MRWFLLCLIAALSACTPMLNSVNQANIIQANTPVGVHAVEGSASWYGPKFAGRQTANGEIFDPNQLTAAHKTLPFGSYIRVTNLDNNQSITVRINDRGPFARGRIIDLSRAAAEHIDMVRTGTARVRLEILDSALAAPTPVAPEAASETVIEASSLNSQTTQGNSRLASDLQLTGFNVVTEQHPVGTLLIFSNQTQSVMVRVSSNSMPLSSGVDFFVAPDLLSRLGETILVLSEAK